MKRALVTGYTFTAATKTLDFSSISGFNARSLVAVVNATQKVMIYGVGITGKGYTSLTGGNVFVLQYDTTSHGNSDILYIIYDDIGGDATNGLDVDVTRMSALVAGSAIIGKVGIDQTTPGTTNAVAATNLPTTVDTNSGAKSASTLRTVHATDDTMIGALTETAPATDTASSGLNGRLQRIAQRLTSLIALLPSALGQTTKTGSLSVALASDMVGTAGSSSTSVVSVQGIASGTTLGTTEARLPSALGQTTASASLPVVLPSDTGAIIQPLNATPVVTSVSSNNADMVASMSVANYRSGSLQLSGFGSATVQVQVSNDGGTTWVAVRTLNLNTGVVATMNAAGIYVFILPAVSLMRIRTTAWVSGTIAGALVLSSHPVDIAPPGLTSSTGSVSVGHAPVSSVNADGDGTNTSFSDGAGNVLRNISRQFVSNGSTFDRVRNNISVSVLTSAARTGTNNTDVTTWNAKTFRVILNITAAPNTASTITVAIRAKDSISSNYITLLTGAAETGSSDQSVPITKTYIVGAGVVATTNISAAEALARTMNVLVTHSNSDSWTYSISVELGV